MTDRTETTDLHGGEFYPPTVHEKELDAPFDTFDYEGAVYHNVGLMQAWVRGYTDPNQHMTTEPPAWTADFRFWLTENKSEIRESFVGPPIIRFPNTETAELFRRAWHDRARARYPYEQMKQYDALNAHKPNDGHG